MLLGFIGKRTFSVFPLSYKIVVNYS